MHETEFPGLSKWKMDKHAQYGRMHLKEGGECQDNANETNIQIVADVNYMSADGTWNNGEDYNECFDVSSTSVTHYCLFVLKFHGCYGSKSQGVYIIVYILWLVYQHFT